MDFEISNTCRKRTHRTRPMSPFTLTAVRGEHWSAALNGHSLTEPVLRGGPSAIRPPLAIPSSPPERTPSTLEAFASLCDNSSIGAVVHSAVPPRDPSEPHLRAHAPTEFSACCSHEDRSEQTALSFRSAFAAAASGADALDRWNYTQTQAANIDRSLRSSLPAACGCHFAP